MVIAEKPKVTRKRKPKLAYGWKKGTVGLQSKIKAQAAGEELSKISNSDEEVKPYEVVDAARDPASVLHPLFTWDNSAAAERYREDQARYLIRHIVITAVVQQSAEPIHIRAFVSVTNEEEHIYNPIARVLEDETKRAEQVRQARLGLIAYRNRWRVFQPYFDPEFQIMFDMISEFCDS